MQIQKRMLWVHNKFLACIAAEHLLFRGISFLTCCNAQSIHIELMCEMHSLSLKAAGKREWGTLSSNWMRVHKWEREKMRCWFLPFPVFQLWFVCCIRFFFSFRSLSLDVCKKATNELMRWNRGFCFVCMHVWEWVFFSRSIFKLYFIVFPTIRFFFTALATHSALI